MTGVGGNTNIFYSHLHLSHPSQQHSSVDEIKWLIKEEKTIYGTLRNLYVQLGPEGTEYSIERVSVDKKPGSDLIGTWERKGTVSISRLERINVIYPVDLVQGSKIKMSKVAPYGYDDIDFKVLVEGEWEREKVNGLPTGWEVFEEHTPFLTAADGVWVGAGGVSRFSFIFSCVSDILDRRR
jgi:hypothetical protein